MPIINHDQHEEVEIIEGERQDEDIRRRDTEHVSTQEMDIIRNDHNRMNEDNIRLDTV